MSIPALNRFSGKRVVVTGGTRGIGRAIAFRFVAEGATVMITGTDQNRASLVAAELASEGRSQVFGIGCDVGSEASVRALADVARKSLGVVDVLINNAGIARRNAVIDISLAEWNQVVGINLTGAFLCIREFLPMLKSAEAPSIVNIASQAAKRGQPMLSHYVASKAGLVGLTRSLALELAPVVRVNAVCPGQIETDMLVEHYREEAQLLGSSPEDVRFRFIEQIPLRRMQSPDSIASVVALLASEDCRDVTGQAINVSGGLVME